jgi:Uma2 family endonuclease
MVTVPLSEYLNTSYRPDCEYIDGELLERDLGELGHSRMQMLASGYLSNREKQWEIFVLPGQRVQVRATRFRVPDISVVKGDSPKTQILQSPPFICIEILSREDSLEQMQDRIDDYLAFGVPHVRVINPRKLRAFEYSLDGMREAKDGVLRAADSGIVVPFSSSISINLTAV